MSLGKGVKVDICTSKGKKGKKTLTIPHYPFYHPPG